MSLDIIPAPVQRVRARGLRSWTTRCWQDASAFRQAAVVRVRERIWRDSSAHRCRRGVPRLELCLADVHHTGTEIGGNGNDLPHARR